MWGEQFVFTKRVYELDADEDGFLTLEVWDDDVIDSDDSLGVAGIAKGAPEEAAQPICESVVWPLLGEERGCASASREGSQLRQ